MEKLQEQLQGMEIPMFPESNPGNGSFSVQGQPKLEHHSEVCLYHLAMGLESDLKKQTHSVYLSRYSMTMTLWHMFSCMILDAKTGC